MRPHVAAIYHRTSRDSGNNGMTIHRNKLEIDHPHHDLGGKVGVERPALRQALTWLVAAELVRRHPNEMRVIESRPYRDDCVTVFARTDDPEWSGGWRRVVVLPQSTDFCLLTHQGWFETEQDDRFSWLEVLLAPNLRDDVIRPLERAEGLPAVEDTPSTTASTIGVRLLAGFAGRTAFTRKPWRLHNGCVEGGDGVRDELFDQLPEINEHRRIRRQDDLHAVTEYRYWFAIEDRIDGKPGAARFAVDTMEGVGFTDAGSVDLMSEYSSCGRMLDAVVSRVCPPAF